MVVWITEWVVRLLGAAGYPALFALMALESMIAPVPSEAVMPFAGFLIAQGEFTWAGAIAASSLGTLAGSYAGYFMGQWGGYAFVNRFGKYLLLDREHLDWSVRWFDRYGEATIFICRFIPVVRHFISIPAGVARMNHGKFALYTFVGGTLWNTFLLWCGFWLRERWELVGRYTHQIDYAVVGLLVLAGGWWIWHRTRGRRAA